MIICGAVCNPLTLNPELGTDQFRYLLLDIKPGFSHIRSVQVWFFSPDQKRRAPRKHLLYAVAENYHQMAQWEQAYYWGRQALDADPENYRHQQLLKEIVAKVKEIVSCR